VWQVHFLMKTQRDRLAMSIDRIFRITIPWILYPTVTVAIIIYGVEQQGLCPDHTDVTRAQEGRCGVGPSDVAFRGRPEPTNLNLALIIGVSGTALTAITSITLVWVHVASVIREQILSVADMMDLALLHAHLDAEDLKDVVDAHAVQTKLGVGWAKATERVFKAYDLDSSGAIDFKELRSMLQQMYPKASATLIRHSMMDARKFSDAEGELDVASFQDAITTIMEFMAKTVQEGDASAEPLHIDRRPPWYVAGCPRPRPRPHPQHRPASLTIVGP
jgi:hypothetical protein